MTIEDEVRRIIAPLAWRLDMVTTAENVDKAVAALMRLMEPPDTGVPLEKQIEGVGAINGIESGYYWGEDLAAAIETLRWVQSRKEAK